MRYCVKCVQPDTRPGIHFSEEGVCGACLYQEESDEKIDWVEREKKLKDIAEWAKKSARSNYDCAVGISGGKDSTFQALYARDRLGLRVLLVNGEPEGITEIGRHNIENLINLGFDCIKLRPNPKVMRKLIKRDFYKCLNPVKVTEYSLWASTYIAARAFKIPLIIQGENPGLTLGARNTGVGTDGNALNACRLNTLSEDWREYAGDGIEKEDLFFFHYDRDAMEDDGIKGVWLQYYAREWSQPGNAIFSIKHGLRTRPRGFDPRDIGTYGSYLQLDSDLVHVNQMLKYIKFGFGQCTDHACYDIRAGRITREEGILLVKAFDGLCADRYIKNFCDYIGISMAEFWKTADSFRGEMWNRDRHGKWSLKEPIWEQCKAKETDIPKILERINIFG